MTFELLRPATTGREETNSPPRSPPPPDHPSQLIRLQHMPTTPCDLPAPAQKRCPACGDVLPTEWSGNDCPRCLVQIAIDWPTRNAPGGPVQPPEIDLLRDRFPALEIDSLIGCGGMGAVYHARQPHLDRSIALKILPVERARDVIAVERFRRESRVLAQLDHPNIVRVYDSGQDGDLLFLVMEFIDGANLRELLASGPVPASEVRQVALQLCAAVQAAHELGCIHRDLKPENILLDESGRVKVTDFGIARWAGERDTGESLTTTSVRIGTPRYMAPEQRDLSGKVDHRADLFAIGIILFELLTGKPPQLDYRAPSQGTGADRRWDRIVARCLKSNPDERYQSAQELATEIQRLIPANPSPAHRRKRWALVALPLLILGTGISLAIPVNRNAGTDLSRLGDGSTEPVNQSVTAIAPLANTTRPSIPHAPEADLSRASTPGQTDAASSPPLAPSPPARPEDHPLVSPRWTWSPPENLAVGVNSPGHESHPTISPDGLTLLFVRDFSSLWQSRRSSLDEPFLTAHRLPGPINDDGPVDSPFLSRDALTIWFASSRQGSLGTLGRNDIWEARRPAIDAPFESPVSLGPAINTPWEESTPCVTDDGLTLYFCIRRPYSSTLADLFVATRDRLDTPFTNPKQLRGNLNSPGNDFFPRLADNGRILYYTTTNPDTRDQKLLVAVRSSTEEQFRALPAAPEVINAGIVSAAALFADDRRIIFDSNRGGGHGGFDLWVSRRIPKSDGSRVETGASD